MCSACCRSPPFSLFASMSLWILGLLRRMVDTACSYRLVVLVVAPADRFNWLTFTVIIVIIRGRHGHVSLVVSIILLVGSCGFVFAASRRHVDCLLVETTNPFVVAVVDWWYDGEEEVVVVAAGVVVELSIHRA